MSIFHHCFPGLDDGKMTQDDYLSHLEMAYRIWSRQMQLTGADAMDENLDLPAAIMVLKKQLKDIL
jgi:hypothetical protein